jgi:hypothetical protein
MVEQAVIEPPLRPRLPAYGKTLLMQRRLGQHPETITVIYGDNWSGVKPPRLGVRPLQYQPGLVDWRVVAGVKVELIDRAEGLADCDVEANRFGKFYSLIAELVDATAYVVVRFPDGERWGEKDADLLAYECRGFSSGRSCWPGWWSDDRERLQQAAFIDYLSDAELALRRRFVRDRQ